MSNAPTAPAVTTSPMGLSGATEIVSLDGREIGQISGGAGETMAQPVGARFGTYWFADRDAAIAACVSYAERGHWTGEI